MGRLLRWRVRRKLDREFREWRPLTEDERMNGMYFSGAFIGFVGGVGCGYTGSGLIDVIRSLF